jgi:hypothetical protein
MRRDWVINVSIILMALPVGWVAWSGNAILLPASILFPILWSNVTNRSSAAIVAHVYFLAASRGLPQGVASYYGADLWPGLLLWLVASVGFVLVQTLLWTPHAGWWRAARYVLASVLMAVPPFGILGWAQPITSAGILFPGWGWVGLVVMLVGLAIMTTRAWPIAGTAFVGFWLWSATHWTDPAGMANWHGVHLTLGASLGRDASLGRQQLLADTINNRKALGPAVTVLPESALGFWTPTVERFWTRQLAGADITVIAGTSVVVATGYDNVLVAINRNGSRILYRERMPVPGSMWQPWRAWVGQTGGTAAHFFGNPIAEVAGTKVAPLICYEQLLVWPILHSMLRDPEVIAAAGDGWWTAGTSIVPIQRAATQAWARLFGIPLVMSFNT